MLGGVGGAVSDGRPYPDMVLHSTQLFSNGNSYYYPDPLGNSGHCKYWIFPFPFGIRLNINY
jgi:hypothetical protein